MKRLQIIGDAGCQTGFARVVKGIADHLHNTGEWDIVVRGINFRPTHAIPYAYEVLPVATDHVEDPLGFHDFPDHLEEDRPDVQLVVQDLWNINTYMAFKPRELPTVAYFPVDTPNLKWSYALAVGAVAEAATYTDFAARESAAAVQDAVDVVAESSIHESKGRVTMDTEATWFSLPKGKSVLQCRLDRMARYQNPAGWNVIPHGADLSLFEPRDRKLCRRLFNLPTDAFVVGSVGTNQFRKRQDLTLLAFADLLQTHPTAILVLHCMGGDRQGWDLQQLARYFGIERQCRFVHHEHPNLSDDDLVSLYNTFDVHVNTSGGEGWGLTSVESAACGTPQLVPDWSATREIWADTGVLLPVRNFRFEPKFLNTAHCEIDTVETAQVFRLLADDPELRALIGARCRARAESMHTWDEIGGAFEVLLRQALQEPEPASYSFRRMQEGREPGVRSELAGVSSIEHYHRLRAHPTESDPPSGA